jgi:hypothetical protein
MNFLSASVLDIAYVSGGIGLPGPRVKAADADKQAHGAGGRFDRGG